jgi:two-component system cell cycle sensor histidine kinase/response regulator CckA
VWFARRAASDPAADALLAALLDAFEQPAALTDIAGRIRLANAPWRESAREVRSPLGGEGLFAAFRAAARDGAGEGRLCVPGSKSLAGARVVVTRLPGQRFLVRLDPPAGAAPLAAGPADLPFAAARVEGDELLAATVTHANGAFDALVGRPAAGARLADLLEAEDFPIPVRGGPAPVRLLREAGGGAHLYAALQAPGVHLVHLIDVSRQRALQAQLAQRTKMEAVGQLAGGVAHDFNNLLTAIRMRADELLQRHPLGDPAYESLAEIRSTVGRAAGVVGQLLAFSRKATVKREVLDLAQALGDVEVLLRRLLRETVTLRTRYDADLPPVRMDRGQLETAVVNLVVNARDAIGPAPGGLIRLEARRLLAAEAAAMGFPPAGDHDDRVLVEIADNGPGVAPQALERIFDPFFTTKAAGEGTGLGLATVQGIVEQAGGWIRVESSPGSGAAFRVALPVWRAPLRVEPPPAPAQPPVRRDLSGRGRILLVEDEILVRGITARLLRARGYEVLEAPDGEAALDIARDNAGRIDLMISDVIMPGMDGPALLAAARPYLAGVPVMFVSGYAEAEFSQLLEGESGVTFLPKPLDIRTLAEHVKAALEPPRGA